MLIKKILILNGAGRKNGKTSEMIRAFSKEAGKHHEIAELFLQDLHIAGCINCQGCGFKEKDSEYPCVQNDDMNQVYKAFRKADVIVFASPVYWWDITGTLKTAVDRLYALVRNSSVSMRKETVLLMTSGGSTIDHAANWYSGFEAWLGWKNLGMAMNSTEEAARIGASV